VHPLALAREVPHRLLRRVSHPAAAHPARAAHSGLSDSSFLPSSTTATTVYASNDVIERAHVCRCASLGLRTSTRVPTGTGGRATCRLSAQSARGTNVRPNFLQRAGGIKRVGVGGSEHASLNFECSHEKRLGLEVLALVDQSYGQCLRSIECGRMPLAEHAHLNAEELQLYRLGFGMLPLLREGIGEISCI
jgi:hypothetical protein